MKKHFIYFIFLIITSGLLAQPGKVDSLRAELSKDNPDSVKVRTYIRLGFQYLYINRDSSLLYYGKALSLAHSQGLASAELNAKMQIARAVYEAGNYAEALRISLQNVDAAEKIGDSITLWFAKRLILWVYGSLGDAERELSYARELLTWTRNFPESGEYLIYYEMVQRYLGDRFMESDMLDSAAYYLTRSYNIAKKLSSDETLAFNTSAWGRYYFKKQQYDSAMSYFILSTRFASGVSRFDVTIRDRLKMASIFLLKNDPGAAMINAKISLNEAQSIPDTLSMIEAASMVAAAFEYTKQMDSAYSYLKYSQELQDKVSLQAKINSANNLVFNEAIYQQQLENQKKQTEENYKYNLRIYILLGGALILLLASVLLYRNFRQKKKDATRVQRSYEQLKATQAQLIQSEKMASLGELTAGIAHEIQNPLNFVNNFSEVNKELINELKQEIENGDLNEIKVISGDIEANEDKIIHHGKRADAIVKNMLLHSRGGTGAKEPTDINAMADEYLRLSFHGMRARDKSFNAKYETSFDNTIGKINIVQQEIGRVLLNLINNAFYAVNEKAKQNISGYEPTVTLSTKKVNGKIEICVKDNGNGIPESIKEKIFQPFFTTKPTGSGTGLGLSLSYDIIKAHGGEINVSSKNGEGSEFIIKLPIA